ncbi:MAG: organic hydroperoxide resistance protein [Candidatus Dormibacteraeota bacterium]|nr:organic hydroperoxide resistance protein [Candidatus Dormibacteraeota bacterium]
MNVLYTAEATARGGRMGHGHSSDGKVDVDLSIPKEVGGDGGPGTNPEQLFGTGYAACFEGASVTAGVGIGPSGRGSYGLEVGLAVDLPSITDPDGGRSGDRELDLDVGANRIGVRPDTMRLLDQVLG